MKTIIGGRGTGKTTALLRQIDMDGYSNPVIVVPNNTIKRLMYINIFPKKYITVITFKEYINLCNRSPISVASGGIPTFYFDDIDGCLQTEAPRVFVAGATSDDVSPTGYNSMSSIGGMSVNIDDRVPEFYFDDILGWEKDNKPHIDHVKFNGPATIVFWKDGTKTVVKFDKKGTRSKKLAVLYAFIRKIYGEGKNYHYILEEIENACK